MASVLCLGMSAIDAIYRVAAIPSRPVKVLAHGFAECGGGMAANASVAVARLGGRAAYWGRIGEDALGERIVAELAAEGVDVRHVRRVAGAASPSAAILVGDDGERLVCAYNDPSLDRDARWLPLREVVDFDAVLVDVRWPEGARGVMAAARASRRIVVLDGDVGPAETLAELAPAATHVAYSQPGLELASGIGEPGAGLRRVARPDQIVGVTLGADGFLWIDEEDRERHIKAPAVRAVDTLAAGDVWHGAFALALAEARSVELAARFANAAAAIKCSRFGGRSGCPHRHEVKTLLKQ